MKMSALRIPSLCFALAVITLPACAEEKLDFVGEAQSGCALDDLRNGHLALGADLASWTTDTPATFAVSATAGGEYQLTVRGSSTWAEAPNGTPTTTFSLFPVLVAGTNANRPFSGSLDDLGRVCKGV